MITNPEGKVAIKWAIERRTPKPIKIDGTDRVYILTPQHNIFLMWADVEDVGRLLNHKEKSCNCGNKPMINAFVLASRLDVVLWETGDRNELNPAYKEE